MSDQKELDALCEVPLKVHVGEEEVEVFPPTLAKLNAATPHWATLINKASKIGEEIDKKSKGNIDVEIIFKDLFKFIEELLPVFNIYLAPPGKIESKFTPEQIENGLSLVDMRRILVFIREGVQLGELLKNAVLPVMPEMEKVPTAHGHKS